MLGLNLNHVIKGNLEITRGCRLPSVEHTVASWALSVTGLAWWILFPSSDHISVRSNLAQWHSNQARHSLIIKPYPSLMGVIHHFQCYFMKELSFLMEFVISSQCGIGGHCYSATCSYVLDYHYIHTLYKVRVPLHYFLLASYQPC